MDKLVAEWEILSKKLNLKIKAPYFFKIDNNVIEVNFLLYNFGGIPGTLVIDNYSKIKKYADNLGTLGFSVLEQPEQFEENITDDDLQCVIEMLSEWGWTGPENERPEWLLNVSPEDDKIYESV